MAPTYEMAATFERDLRSLSAEQHGRFLAKVAELRDDLAAGRTFRPGLRVKAVRGAPGVYEITWARDGRATCHVALRPGGAARVAHVAWRRLGTHAVFDRP